MQKNLRIKPNPIQSVKINDKVNLKNQHGRFNAALKKLNDISKKGALLFVGLDPRHFA
jgi:hypothetical protein